MACFRGGLHWGLVWMRGLCIVVGRNLAKEGTINEAISLVIVCRMDCGIKGEIGNVLMCVLLESLTDNHEEGGLGTYLIRR